MGAVTVGVSLPREWVGERGLVPGQSVFLHPLPDGSLVLRDSDARRGPSTVTLPVDPREPGEHLFRRLVGAYLAGATEFVLSGAGGLAPEIRAVARSFTRRIGHIESVSEDSSGLVLRDVSVGAGLPAPQLLRRMFQLVRDLHVRAGASWDPRIARGIDLAASDDEVDRCAWQVERLLGLQLDDPALDATSRGDAVDALRFLLLARDLERLGDHAVLIAEHGVRLAESSPSEPLRRMLSSYHAQALDHLESAFAVADVPDAKRANAVLDVGEALHQAEGALADRILMQATTRSLPPSAIRSLWLVLQSIDRTTAYAQNLAEVGLDRALGRSPGLEPADPSVGTANPSRSSRPVTRGRKQQE